MEEVHHVHKETTGWVAVLRDWRESRTRRDQRERRVATPWSLRARDDWSA